MLKKVVKKRIRSFKYAFQGIYYLFRAEPNAKIHLLASILAVTFGFVLSISPAEWLLVILCIFSVFAAEAFNTAVEQLVNLISPEHHPLAGRAKDLSAGAVLLTAIGSAICGALIFLPRIIDLLFLY